MARIARFSLVLATLCGAQDAFLPYYECFTGIPLTTCSIMPRVVIIPRGKLTESVVDNTVVAEVCGDQVGVDATMNASLACCPSELPLMLGIAAREWDCATYVRIAIERELAGREPWTRAAPLDARFSEHCDALDVLALDHGSGVSPVTEGNLWRLLYDDDDARRRGAATTTASAAEETLMRRKRQCLLASLAMALPSRATAAAARGGGGGRVAEIGFNAGHSAAMMLATFASPPVSIVSFDICRHGYTVPAYEQLRDTFGVARLRLVCGDSLESVPRFVDDGGGARFDAVLIDGGHLYHQVGHFLSMWHKTVPSHHSFCLSSDPSY